jgi:hypothetical protein
MSAAWMTPSADRPDLAETLPTDSDEACGNACPVIPDSVSIFAADNADRSDVLPADTDDARRNAESMIPDRPIIIADNRLDSTDTVLACRALTRINAERVIDDSAAMRDEINRDGRICVPPAAHPRF